MYDLILLKAYNNDLIKIHKLYFCQKIRQVFIWIFDIIQYLK